MVHFSDSDMLESLSIIGYLIVENEQLMQGWWVFSQPEENTLTGSAHAAAVAHWGIYSIQRLRPLRVLLITHHSFLLWFCSALLGKDWWWCSTVFPVYSLKHQNFCDFRQPSLMQSSQTSSCGPFSACSLLAWYILLTKRAVDTHSVFEALSRAVHSEFFFLCLIMF